MTPLFVILTVLVPGSLSVAPATTSKSWLVTPEPGTTRMDLHKWAMRELLGNDGKGATLFFSAEPAELPAGGAS